MKKVLSIALALIMALSTMVMLVPTASAAVETNIGAVTGVGGKVYYEQDFDDIDPTLVDKDLAAALGWSNPGSTNTIWLENGKLRAFSQYTPTGVYPPTANTWAGGYSTAIVTDPDIKQNAIVLEYKFTYNRRAAGEENDVTVTTLDGTTKTVKADGQGGYQFAAFNYHGVPNQESKIGSSSSVSADNMLLRINLGGNGQETPFKAFDQTGTHQAWWKSSAIDRVNTLPEGDTCTLEYYNNPVVTTESASQLSSSIMNREYSVEVVIEPYAQRMYAFVDGILIQTFNANGYTGGNYGAYDWERLITDTIGLWVKPGVDATFDDIKISEYVPALTISEMMLNGTAAMTSENVIGNTSGKYQWIELTNTSDATVNVYDYALNITNNWVGTDTIGDEAYANANNWTRAGSGSSLGYFTPGAKTIGNYTFDSPAYEDGTLAPGASAIVLIPDVPAAGGADVSDEAFKTYLTGLGMPDTTKLFVCDNTSDIPFVLGIQSNEWCSVAIVKAENTSTDGGYTPVALCAGQSNEYSPAWAESIASLSAKSNGSGTNWYGMSAKNNASFTNEMINAKFSEKTDKSFEISYSGWMSGNEAANLKWGFQKYNATTERIGIDGSAVTATPGYVPVDCRRVIDIDANGTLTTGAVHTDTTVTVTAPAEKLGYEIQMFVDGVKQDQPVVAGSEVSVTYTAAEMTNASDHSISFEYYAVDPISYRARISEDGTTVQLITGLNDVDLENDTLALNIMVQYSEELGGALGMATKNCTYVYESLYDYAHKANKDASYYGFDYVNAVNITNMPKVEAGSADAYDLIIYVEAVKNDVASTQGAVAYYFNLVEEAAAE